MAGIVGTVMPRYCLFGDTVNTACRMKSHGMADRIHISPSTYTSLKKHAVYVMFERGTIHVKGKGTMTTYWLAGRADLSGNIMQLYNPEEDASGQEETDDPAELPGEILPYQQDLTGPPQTVQHNSMSALSTTLNPKCHDDVSVRKKKMTNDSVNMPSPKMVTFGSEFDCTEGPGMYY